LRVIHPIEFRLLAGVHFIRLASGGDLAFSAYHHDARSVAVLVDIDAERPGFLHRKREVGRVHFIQVAFPHFPHTEIDRAFRDARLEYVFVQIQKGQRSHAAKMQRSLARLQLCSRILIRPQLVANRHRAILRCRRPIFGPRRLKRHISVQIADARDARWWIAFVGSRLRRDKEQKAG
jgi:hypothetical protein